MLNKKQPQDSQSIQQHDIILHMHGHEDMQQKQNVQAS